MAETWHIPPWRILNECSEDWFNWWLSIRVEKQNLQQEEANKVKRRSGR